MPHDSAPTILLPRPVEYRSDRGLALPNRLATARSFETQPAGRVLCGLAYDSHRNVTILFGGRLFGGFYTNETWRHDGNDWLPLSPSTSPSGRATNILVYDRARQRVVLFGGENSFGFQDETWDWDGGNWLLRNPLHRPPDRNGGAYARLGKATRRLARRACGGIGTRDRRERR